MKFKEFIELFDNHNGTTVVNDNTLTPICKGNTHEISQRDDLANKEVLSFGFYDNELCIRVTTETETHGFTCEDCPYYYAEFDDIISTCHHNGDDLAPCEYEDDNYNYDYEEY